MIERVSTGVEGLDVLVNGGFPKGSLILVAGNPGTGKTILSAQFLYRAIVEGEENCIYVSFAEDRRTFYQNMMNFNFDFEKLEEMGRFKFLDLTAVRERGVSFVLDLILNEINRMKAGRLVIDSFSAMAQAFEKPIDARIVIHLILSRIVRQLGCTTLMVVEVPTGRERIGLEIEEFIADGILMLRAGEIDGRLLRDVEILKLRGTPLPERKAVFTLKGGFNVFPPFKARPIKERKRFKPVPDPPDMFSTGVPEMDEMLGGGLPKGSSVLLEIDGPVSTFQYHLILNPIPWNFLVKGRGVIVIPSSGVDYNIVKRRAMEGGLTMEECNRLLRVCVARNSVKEEVFKLPFLVPLEGRDVRRDYDGYLRLVDSLMEETGQPVLRITGVDHLISSYNSEDAIRVLNMDATRLREKGNLGILILKPLHRELSKPLSSIVDVHIKITREHGAILIYGVKPRTGLYVVDMDTSRGYPYPKIMPII